MELVPTPITWTPGHEGVGVFNITSAPKVDSGNGDRRTWSCSIVSEVATAEVAGQLDLFHGDISRHWLDASEETWRTKIDLEPLTDQHLVVSIEGGGTALAKLRAELGRIKADFNTSRQVHISKFKLRGVGVGDSNALVDLQGKLVRLVVHMQVSNGGGDITPDVGQVVSGTTATGQVVVGRMVGVDGESDLIQLDDFGTTYEVAKVASAYTLESTTPQDVDHHLVLYRDQVVENGGELSWENLVLAIAEASTADEVQKMSGSTMYINAAVVQRAIAGSALPPEVAEA